MLLLRGLKHLVALDLLGLELCAAGGWWSRLHFFDTHCRSQRRRPIPAQSGDSSRCSSWPRHLLLNISRFSGVEPPIRASTTNPSPISTFWRPWRRRRSPKKRGIADGSLAGARYRAAKGRPPSLRPPPLDSAAPVAVRGTLAASRRPSTEEADLKVRARAQALTQPESKSQISLQNLNLN